MNTDKEPDPPGKALIKEQLRRSFNEKATEELPSELVSLIARLREQDDKDGK